MALVQVTAGNRAITTDVNQFYNLLKGVSGSGETVTLIYNAAASLIFQPSSDPAAGTEAVQIKNNAGTVQSALSFDGKFYAADGVAALPGVTFEQDKTLGMYRPSANVLAFTSRALDALRVTNPASAVNYIQVSGSATGSALTLTATGTDTNISINLVPKGNGTIQSGGVALAVGTALADDPNVVMAHYSAIILPAVQRQGAAGSGGWGMTGQGLNVDSAATANSWDQFSLPFDATGTVLAWAKAKKFMAYVKPTNSIAAGCTIFVGFRDRVPGTQFTRTTHKYIGFCFDTSDGLSAVNWLAVNSNGATETKSDTGVAVALGEVHLAVTFDGTTVTFYITGVQKATSTTNLPSGASLGEFNLSAYVDNKATAASRQLVIANMHGFWASS